jgi:hypothetical protein
MKYIRYLLLYAFDIAIIVMCIYLYGFESVSPITSKAISISGIISIILYLSKQIKILTNEIKHPIYKVNGVKNYYLRQKSIYIMESDENWKMRIREIIPYIRADLRKMELVYEDDNRMTFETENEIGKGARKRNRNKIMLEFNKKIKMK